MAVSTIQSALGATGGINQESNKVIAMLNGNRTAEQMIQEYFGLRKEVIYSDDGTEVIDMINEFRDPEALKFKKVRYNDYFASKGLTEEMFYKNVPRNLVYVEAHTTNLIEDVTNIPSTGVVEEKPIVPSPRGRASKNSK